MFREIHGQLRILLAQMKDYTEQVVKENELLRKKITELIDENSGLRKELAERSSTKSD